MPTIILIAELVIQYRSVGEEALRLQVGLHSRSVVLHVAIDTAQGVPCHGGAVVLPVRIIIVGGVADEGVGGEGYVALVVGLRAQDGIECPCPPHPMQRVARRRVYITVRSFMRALFVDATKVVINEQKI